jgi:hypothetical protein
MWKIVVGFAVFAGLALFILSKGGDIDMGGEKHGEVPHVEAPAAANPAVVAASAAAPVVAATPAVAASAAASATK